jgi:hypothetical protein
MDESALHENPLKISQAVPRMRSSAPSATNIGRLKMMKITEPKPTPTAGENAIAEIGETLEGHRRDVMKYPSKIAMAIPSRPRIIATAS